MTDLTIRSVVRDAPGAAPVRNASKEGLISTSAFLRFVEREYRMRPVLAVQGKGHIDASNDSPAKMGRHLVIVSQNNAAVNRALFLLNSHQKHRRTHIGFGFWDIERESFLIGPSMAIQRWKGFEEATKSIVNDDWASACRTSLLMLDWNEIERKAFGRYMARHGYTDFVAARPSGTALVEGLSGGLMVTALDVIARMREGNIPAPDKSRRNIKGVRRPDGLFHAGLTAMSYIVDMAIARNALDEKYRLLPLAGRLPRP
jgi:hypothetical protein